MNRWLAAFSGVSSWTKDRRCPLGHGTAKVFAVAATASALLWFVQAPLRAQNPTATGAGTEAQGTRAVCTISRGPNALWQLAQCCSKSLAGNRDCREYDPKYEYIILKDNAPTKPDSYMIIPTKKITGIEDREIFAMPFVDFWEYGWQRSRQYPGKPASRTAMAINSAHARTQEQLHIHISCVRPDVSKILEAQNKEIGTYPAEVVTLQLPPHNNTYRVVKVTRLRGTESPYEVIQVIPGVQRNMGDQSIAVVGSQKRDEYYVLETYYHGADSGAAEELLDQTCKTAGAGP
jgi:CDP-diacylglycerol pyrophosphatase